MGLLSFSGRLLLASIFLLSGVMKLVHHELGPANPILQYMTPKVDASLSRVHSLTGVQLPVSQEQLSTLLFVAGSVELLGATLFTLNVKLGAVLLMLVLVPTTLVMHDFWDYATGTPAHQIEFTNFIKNVSIFGAFLLFAATPRAGPLQKYKQS